MGPRREGVSRRIFRAAARTARSSMRFAVGFSDRYDPESITTTAKGVFPRKDVTLNNLWLVLGGVVRVVVGHSRSPRCRSADTADTPGHASIGIKFGLLVEPAFFFFFRDGVAVIVFFDFFCLLFAFVDDLRFLGDGLGRAGAGIATDRRKSTRRSYRYGGNL